MVRNALREAIQRVEGVAGERGRHDPLVMRLVEVLVDARVVETAVDPVDERIGEDDEEGELQEVVAPEGRFGKVVVHLGIAADFEKERRQGEQGHDGEGLEGLPDLHPDLVLKILGVVEALVVEDEKV